MWHKMLNLEAKGGAIETGFINLEKMERVRDLCDGALAPVFTSLREKKEDLDNK